jgi:hypothetical protein
MDTQKTLQFPLRIFVDDEYRENVFKGITFKELSADWQKENVKQNQELGIEWL